MDLRVREAVKYLLKTEDYGLFMTREECQKLVLGLDRHLKDTEVFVYFASIEQAITDNAELLDLFTDIECYIGKFACYGICKYSVEEIQKLTKLEHQTYWVLVDNQLKKADNFDDYVLNCGDVVVSGHYCDSEGLTEEDLKNIIQLVTVNVEKFKKRSAASVKGARKRRQLWKDRDGRIQEVNNEA